uniref:Nucleophosmin n=1 Tax=Chlorocebus sabaeus TaxID=60711 RepID=A0A0D9RQ13_CHLSB
MEDLIDRDMSPLRPQNYLFSCELKADKDDHFKVDNDENEHQTVSLGAGAKDELQIIEAEAINYEGSPKNVCIANSFPWSFEITHPVVLRLMCGSGPVHISGQHLVAVVEDAESEDEEEEDVKLLSISGKQSATGGGRKIPQKKVKLAADENDDDEEDDDFDDEEPEEKAPVKQSIRDTPAKKGQKSNQNGKDSKPSSIPRSKGQESFKKQEKTPKTPKGPSSVEDIRAKMEASIEKHFGKNKMRAGQVSINKNCKCLRLASREASGSLQSWQKRE